MQRSGWYRWGKRITSNPFNVIVLVLVFSCGLPISVRLLFSKPCKHMSIMAPPEAEPMLGMHLLHEQFSESIANPQSLYLLVETPPSCLSGVRSNGYFQAICGLAGEIFARAQVVDASPVGKTIDILGVAFLTRNGAVNCMPWLRTASEAAAAAIAGNLTFTGHSLLTGVGVGPDFDHYHQLYSKLWSRVVSPGGTASLIAVRPPWDPISDNGFALVHEIRMLLRSREALAESHGINFAYGMPVGGGTGWLQNTNFSSSSEIPWVQTGGPAPLDVDSCTLIRGWDLSEASVEKDYIEFSAKRLPWSIVISCALTFPLVAIAFGSVLAPVKLFLTVTLPLTWIYGAAVLVFKDGALEWLGENQPFREAGGLHWLVPCSSSTIMLALALDYDVFYFGRVWELRKSGLSSPEAARRGLAAAGPVIMCAGVIFAVEFSGLFLSSIPLNIQLGFVIVFGIMLDTFVIRTSVVPALLSLNWEANWWPTAMPEVRESSELRVAENDGGDSSGPESIREVRRAEDSGDDSSNPEE